MKAKILLPALIAGLFAVTGVQAGNKYPTPAPAPEDTSWDDSATPAPAAPAPSYEFCYKAKPVKHNSDYSSKSSKKPKPELVEVKKGKWYQLGSLELICVEPAAPVVTPPPAPGSDCKKPYGCPGTGTGNGYPSK